MGFVKRQQQTGLGLRRRRRERTKHKTTLRVCHVKEVWEASADLQPILAEGRQAASLQHWRVSGHGCLSRHPTKRTVLVQRCDFIGDISVAVAAALSRSRHRLFSAGCDAGISLRWCRQWHCVVLGLYLQGAEPGWWLGWAGLVGAPRQDRQAKCKARSAYVPCCD